MINAGNLKSVILKLHFIWKSLVYVIPQNVFRNIPLEAGKSSMDFSAEWGQTSGVVYLFFLHINAVLI